MVDLVDSDHVSVYSVCDTSTEDCGIIPATPPDHKSPGAQKSTAQSGNGNTTDVMFESKGVSITLRFLLFILSLSFQHKIGSIGPHQTK